MTVFSALATVVRGACLMVAVWLAVEAAAWAQATTAPVTPAVAAVVKAVATEAEATVKAFNAGVFDIHEKVGLKNVLLERKLALLEDATAISFREDNKSDNGPTN
jgi:hypothetical protein